MTINNFLIGSGYCEDQNLTYLAVSHSAGFDTTKHAMKALVETIKECIKRENKQAKWCAVCGKGIVKKPAIGIDTVVKWFKKELIGGNINSNAYDYFENCGWTFVSIKGGKTAIVYSFELWIRGHNEGNIKIVEIVTF